MAKRSDGKTNRLSVWGDSLMNKLSSRARKRRKREASKKRRAAKKMELARAMGT